MRLVICLWAILSVLSYLALILPPSGCAWHSVKLPETICGDVDRDQ
jgi:hypothetical protein